MTLPDFKAGSTFTVILGVSDDGTALPLAGATATAKLRNSADGSVVGTLSCSVDTPATGFITITETDETLTAAWPPGVLQFDVKVVQAGSNTFFSPTATFTCRRPETR
jgi:hypothetical protein